MTPPRQLPMKRLRGVERARGPGCCGSPWLVRAACPGPATDAWAASLCQLGITAGNGHLCPASAPARSLRLADTRTTVTLPIGCGNVDTARPMTFRTRRLTVMEPGQLLREARRRSRLSQYEVAAR